MKRVIAPIVVGMMLATAAVARGQVGYPPAESPYVDLEHSQEFSLVVGRYHAHRDPADVGPQSGLLTGLHYEWRAGGPAHLVADVARISSDRNIIDPLKAGLARDLGVESRPLYTADVDLGLSLTGSKSWHHLVPEIGGGVGFVSDFRTLPDSGGFKFGTRFALNWGGGIRWVPGGRWQLRGDIKDRMYTLAYPQTYYETPSGGTPVIPSTQAKSFWTNNPAYTLGLSWLF